MHLEIMLNDIQKKCAMKTKINRMTINISNFKKISAIYHTVMVFTLPGEFFK